MCIDQIWPYLPNYFFYPAKREWIFQEIGEGLCRNKKLLGFGLKSPVQCNQKTVVTTIDKIVYPSLGMIAFRIGKEKDSHCGAESELTAEDQNVGRIN